jgi:serine/threonine protein phosphatase PrpC
MKGISVDSAASEMDTKVDLTAPQDALPPPAVRTFGRTDRGLIRTSNQDHFLIAELARTMWVHQTSLPQPHTQYGNRRGHLFLIADGMGGHKGGEIASALTVATVEDFMLNVFRSSDDFQTALKEAHARILAETVSHPEVSGMGTTLTMAVSNNWRLFVTHAGDSRCYLFRSRSLRQITTDHTIVREMVQRGILKPEDVAHHKYRHVVTNAVGGSQSTVRVDVQEVNLQPEDVVLLCTDGLTDMLSDARIANILECEPDSHVACDRLVNEALKAGGRDNISAIVTHFHAAEA